MAHSQRLLGRFSASETRRSSARGLRKQKKHRTTPAFDSSPSTQRPKMSMRAMSLAKLTRSPQGLASADKESPRRIRRPGAPTSMTWRYGRHCKTISAQERSNPERTVEQCRMSGSRHPASRALASFTSSNQNRVWKRYAPVSHMAHHVLCDQAARHLLQACHPSHVACEGACGDRAPEGTRAGETSS